jgi:phospholipase C
MQFRLFTTIIRISLALTAAGCSQHAADTSMQGALLPNVAAARGSSGKIGHVVIVIQENRSFDNFFATFPGADGAKFGMTHDGKRVRLLETGLNIKTDLCHQYSCFTTEWDNGKMDGFDLAWYALPNAPIMGKYAYQYVDPAQIAPYWSMAKQYVLADRMFQTQGSGSFTSHLSLIAGDTTLDSSETVIDAPWTGLPWGCDAPPGSTSPILTSTGTYEANGGPFPCYDFPTLGERLDAAKVSWKYYTPPLSKSGKIWNAYDAIKAVRYGPDWHDNMATSASILKDAARGKLPAVSWVVPEFLNSDHPGIAHGYGPSWVASIVNAIGAGPDWNSTAIVIVWDDWGGLYDHVPPPQITYSSLGFRVPMIVISPYARKGYVSHTQYEFASILKFVEEIWRLPPLHRADVRANSIDDVFDFALPARKFAKIPAPQPAEFFLHQKPSGLPVDTE